MFKYVTDIRDVHEWFPTLKSVYEVDKYPLAVGKVYKGEVNLIFSELNTMQI